MLVVVKDLLFDKKFFLAVVLSLACLTTAFLWPVAAVSALIHKPSPEAANGPFLSRHLIPLASPLLTETKKITASNGAAFHQFGLAVSVSGDTAVVGANQDAGGPGAAYIYERNQGGLNNWGQTKIITASDGAFNDQFGISVAISGDTIVVGAWRDNSDQGAAYIFDRNQGGANNWGQVKKLLASDGVASDQFGIFVAISGNTVVVGASGDDALKGAAYVFDRNQGGANNWGQVKKLLASDGVASDGFGNSVAISGDTTVVGAHFDNSS
ncbi:MAG: FG-GAP repeat protein, partial [Chloroflexi bacterium]|nr:FG-GAP repeat protein [Chloroflexota bacterium]